MTENVSQILCGWDFDNNLIIKSENISKDKILINKENIVEHINIEYAIQYAMLAVGVENEDFKKDLLDYFNSDEIKEKFENEEPKIILYELFGFAEDLRKKLEKDNVDIEESFKGYYKNLYSYITKNPDLLKDIESVLDGIGNFLAKEKCGKWNHLITGLIKYLPHDSPEEWSNSSKIIEFFYQEALKSQLDKIYYNFEANEKLLEITKGLSEESVLHAILTDNSPSVVAEMIKKDEKLEKILGLSGELENVNESHEFELNGQKIPYNRIIALKDEKGHVVPLAGMFRDVVEKGKSYSYIDTKKHQEDRELADLSGLFAELQKNMMSKTEIKPEYFVFSDDNENICKNMYQFFVNKCGYPSERVCILYTGVQNSAGSEKFSEFVQNIINKKDQVLNEGYVEQSELRECPKTKAAISKEKDSGSKEFTRIVEKFSIDSVKRIMPETESAQQIVDSGRC